MHTAGMHSQRKPYLQSWPSLQCLLAWVALTAAAAAAAAADTPEGLLQTVRMESATLTRAHMCQAQSVPHHVQPSPALRHGMH